MLDLDQVFYPGLVSDEDKAITKAHPAWPVVLALHYNTGQKIFVTEVGPEIRMRTQEGGSVLKVDDKISISLGAYNFSAGYLKPMIKSQDVKYVLAKLKPEGEIIGNIKDRIEGLDQRLIKNSLEYFLSLYKQKNYPDGEYKLNLYLYGEDAAEAIRAAFDPALKRSAELKEKFVKLDIWDKKLEIYNNLRSEFFYDKNKYLIIKGQGVWIAGKFRMLEGDLLIKRDFKIYKTIDDFPDQLKGALAWWKIVREGAKDGREKLYYHEWDPYHFFPIGLTIDRDVGGMHVMVNNNLPSFILDIPGEQSDERLDASVQSDFRGGPGSKESEIGDSEIEAGEPET